MLLKRLENNLVIVGAPAATSSLSGNYSIRDDCGTKSHAARVLTPLCDTREILDMVVIDTPTIGSYFCVKPFTLYILQEGFVILF
jgi:hypothetical protein